MPICARARSLLFVFLALVGGAGIGCDSPPLRQNRVAEGGEPSHRGIDECASTIETRTSTSFDVQIRPSAEGARSDPNRHVLGIDCPSELRDSQNHTVSKRVLVFSIYLDEVSRIYESCRSIQSDPLYLQPLDYVGSMLVHVITREQCAAMLTPSLDRVRISLPSWRRGIPRRLMKVRDDGQKPIGRQASDSYFVLSNNDSFVVCVSISYSPVNGEIPLQEVATSAVRCLNSL